MTREEELAKALTNMDSVLGEVLATLSIEHNQRAAIGGLADQVGRWADARQRINETTVTRRATT